MNYDLTIERDVVQYMKDSTSSESWARRCEYVKDANNGDYPDFLVFSHHLIRSNVQNYC